MSGGNAKMKARSATNGMTAFGLDGGDSTG